MQEVVVKRFEKGDFVKGKASNGYNITDERMTRGEVIRVDDDTMHVRILEHAFKSEIGRKYGVHNSTECFELLPKVNNKASDSVEIHVIAEKGSEFVDASVNYKGRIYDAHAECSLDDEFDLRKGAALALSRAFDLMDEKAKEPKTPDGPVKVGDFVRVTDDYAGGGLRKGDLAEVIGIGRVDTPSGKPYVYVASKEKSGYSGDSCTYPGPEALKQPFTYLADINYEILPEQPVRSGKVGK